MTILKIIITILLISFIIISINHIKIKNNGNSYYSHNLIITSDAFIYKDFIPIKYTGLGENISPPLKINNIDPKGKSIAIIMEDQITPFFKIAHWLIWDIPADINYISSSVPNNPKVFSLANACQGKNIYSKIGYLGPNPPFGTHNYIIKVYILDSFLNLKPGANKNKLLKTINNKIIQYGQIECKFSK